MPWITAIAKKVVLQLVSTAVVFILLTRYEAHAQETRIFASKRAIFEQLSPLQNESILKLFSPNLLCKQYDPSLDEEYYKYGATLNMSTTTISVSGPPGTKGFLFRKTPSGFFDK